MAASCGRPRKVHWHLGAAWRSFGIDDPLESHGDKEKYTVLAVEEACCIGFKNYTLCYGEFGEAKEEFKRCIEASCGTKISWDEVARKDPQGLVSKMALTAKTKQDGPVKRCIIVELNRSGAYSKSVCLEWIVLRRVADDL